MSKFIEIRDDSGVDYVVNVDHIYYMRPETSRINGLTRHRIEVPGAVIWVTKPMYDKVKLELKED